MQPGVVYTTFHHLSGANVITISCPVYKATAVQVMKVTQSSEWQERYRKFSEVQPELLNKRETAKVQ